MSGGRQPTWAEERTAKTPRRTVVREKRTAPDNEQAEERKGKGDNEHSRCGTFLQHERKRGDAPVTTRSFSAVAVALGGLQMDLLQGIQRPIPYSIDY